MEYFSEVTDFRDGSSTALPAPKSNFRFTPKADLGARPDRGCDGHLLQASRLRLPLRG
jgi:hypothetical protein